MSARHAVGIDLGTTHCAIARASLAGESREVEILPVPQLVGAGAIEARPLLPSFLYLPHPDEFPPGALSLPWDATPGHAIGEAAREWGAKTPIRLVASAKSWLCHAGIDRRAPLLPLDAPEDVQRISPLEASLRYLRHLRSAWDAAHPDAPLAQQDVTVTIPASFDPAARELTAEAAELAGFGKFILLEEPQAAVYSWIQSHGEDWRKQVSVGDVILVVDVGGGTCDFSLVAVTESDGNLELHRIAVGEHILLGGDNMDLALAHVVSAKLAQQGVKLETWQVRALTHACRGAKETLLNADAPPSMPIVVPSRGSKLIGGTLRTELTADEVRRYVLEGFFPRVSRDERPATRARGALTQLGLPYAQDAAVTRHLAAFLGRQEEGYARPTAILFNGGVFKSTVLRERLAEVVNSWFPEAARVLPVADLDVAVARGAAYYGAVRAGRGVRIRGGTAQAYYVGVESALPAVPGFAPPVQLLCLAPFGMEEGSEAECPPQEFGLVVGEPVRLRFFGSAVRRQDGVGTLLEDLSEDEISELGEIEINLPAEGHLPGSVVPVRLHAAVTEVGTLRLEAVPREGAQRWKVELDVRGAQ